MVHVLVCFDASLVLSLLFSYFYYDGGDNMYVLIYMLITDLVSFRSGSIILDTGLSFGDEDDSLMLHNC